ncbi:MAG: N-acetylglutaminylglutamine amidotransferase [Dongiaceae bacterium]
MCGFSGEITFNGEPASVECVRRMTDALAARGPDASGLFAQGRVALGHRRLKIIDLTERAQQPMIDTELGLTLVFNGCIYNYRDLQIELRAKGYRFFSDGDTEVVLKAYHAWGAECVQRFHGMFAFAIVERDSGRAVLARDRLGIKPLYLASDGTARLRFASSLPALLAGGAVDTSIDPVGLHNYMTFHAVVPAPRTILAGVRKVPPATIVTIEPDGGRREDIYWELSYERDPGDLETSAEGWREQIETALRRSVARRMVADVPVGVLLSGGVDSSLIVGLLAEAGQSGLNTFSVGFEAANGESGDEFVYSDRIAAEFGTRHHKIFVPSGELMEALPGAIAAMSEPMVSYDNVGFFLLSRAVSRHVKVVQSGQGADEVFAGYHWYPRLARCNDPASDYARVFFDRDHEEFSASVNATYVNGDHSREFVEAHFGRTGADDAIDKALRIDSTVMLVEDPVKRVDNMTMAWGLEARVPFLDHELVELAATMPAAHKLRDGGKGVLKDVARKFVPAEIIDRPKGYFPVPALKYLDGPYLDYARDMVTSQRARERSLFDRRYVDRLLANPRDEITPLRGSKLWQVVLLEAWLQAHAL